MQSKKSCNRASATSEVNLLLEYISSRRVSAKANAMTHAILVGKGRRITLDELSLLARAEAHLEVHQAADSDGAPAEGASDATEAEITAALGKLSLDGKNVLSAEATVASLALLSLTLAQGRVIRGDCAPKLSSALVDLVNAVSKGGKKAQLPSDAAGFAAGVNALVGPELGIVEDKPYVQRAIALARISLMLAHGT